MYSHLFKYFKQLFPVYQVFLICFLFVAISTVISRCSTFDAIKFLLVEYAFVFLPGYSIISWLGVGFENKLIRSFISYALGYSLSIIIYLVMLLTASHFYILYVYLLLFILSCVYLIRRDSLFSDEAIGRVENKILSLILLVSLVLGCLFFQCNNINPALMDGNWYVYQDLLYWCRNSVAATKCYPLPDLSVFGHSFYYHYFSSIEMAFLKYTTGIEMYDLCFTYSYLITIFLTVSGLYTISKYVIQDPKLLFLPTLFVLFTTSFDYYNHIYFNDHILMASFGFAEGMALFCFSLYCYFRTLRTSESRMKFLLMAMLMLFATTGLKGPLAAILLVGFAVGSVILLFKRKNYVFGIFSGLGLFLSFLIPFILFVVDLNHKAEPGSTGEMALSLVNTVFHSNYFERGYDYLIVHGVPTFLSYAFILILYLLSAFIFPLAVFCLVQKKIEFSDTFVVILSMMITGVFLGMFLSNVGFSQVYFLYSSILCLFILSFISKNVVSSRRYKCLIAIFVFGFLFFSYQDSITAYRGGLSLLRSTEYGRDLLCKLNKIEAVPETGLTINKGEMEGLRWVRDNLPNNCVLLSNKIFSETGDRSFWTSCLSERQVFLESYAFSNVDTIEISKNIKFLKSFYQGDIDARNKVLKLGATHAVIYKNILPHHIPIGCKILYENKEVAIAKI